MPFSAYSNISSATTGTPGGGTPVAGAVIQLESDEDVYSSFDFLTPANDGDGIEYWQDQQEGGGNPISTGWTVNGSPLPIYESGAGDLINGHPYVSKSASQRHFQALVSDNVPGGFSFYLLFDREAGSGEEIVLDMNNTGGDGNLQLLLNSNGNVGYRSDGIVEEVAATVAGLQVLAWIFDEVAEEVRVYRDGVLIGTGTEFFSGGYTLGNGTLPFLADGNGNNDCDGKFLDFWAFKTSHSEPDRIQQTQYLMSRGGI